MGSNRKSHPADAAKISCRLAIVNNESTAEKMSVETSRTPMHMMSDLWVVRVTDKWYSNQTGITSSRRIIKVIIRVTNALIRSLLK